MQYQKTDFIKKEFTEGIPGHVAKARYFYFDIDQADQSDLRILCGGYEQCAPDFALNRRNLAFYTVKFTLGGKGVFICNNKTYPLGFGSLTVFGPQTPHQFKTDPSDPMEHIFLVFTGKQAAGLLNLNRLGSRHCIQVSNPPFIAALMEHILHVGLEKPPYAQDLCQSYLESLLLEQIESPAETEQNDRALASFQKCKHHLEQHFAAISSPAQLAEECHLDIRYIARLFRRYKQIRPHDYLMQLKMNKAASLLLTTHLSIKHIAQMTGIEDPYHFSRVFKKVFRVAPSEYRQSFIEPQQ